MSSENILEVKGLKKFFSIRKGFLNRIVGYNKSVNDGEFTIK